MCSLFCSHLNIDCSLDLDFINSDINKGILVVQYSVFGSILTIGAMVGAMMSGCVADIIGRKRVRIIMDVV